VAFISYLGLLAWPMMAMGWVTNLLQRGRASLDRIDKILQVRPGIDDLSGAEHLKLVQGNIVFENVMFSYGHDKKPVLTGIDIKLDKGKALGIVGPPGSGKTTFANLIPRLFDVTGGRITLDEKDIRNILLKDLRAQISFMPQEPFLFAGTIRENILFGNKEADEKELAKAVKDASLYSTIKSFPEGFDTIIGERGVVLSGGQKQRIALARALLRDRPILILDDPISQVDMETGSAIIDIIKSLTGIKTVIIVSHRLSAVRFADQIIVLDSGRIVESGTHAELIKNDRYYAKTFRLQEIEEELDAY
ncbi:MAG: ABC transporter ATP-binding protein/permease, partial [Proteobacteria bacterium]|nr:ABC transporter ATP-binding protein/permease [Pseudomonadota bacterium]